MAARGGVDRDGDSAMASPPASSSSSSSSSFSASSASAEQRQRAIWSSRVRRELDKCRASPSPSASPGDQRALPPGVSLRSARVDETAGRCTAEFHCFVPLPEGSDALALVPLTVLVISMPFSARRVARGDAQFPFLAPTVEVRAGGLYLPQDMLVREKPRLGLDDDEDDDDDDEEDDHGAVIVARPPGRRWLLRLPMLEHWSPSNTLLMLLDEFSALVQHSDPQPAAVARADGASTTAATKKPQMRMRRRDVHGTVYPTQEVDPATSSLVAAPMLLQSSNIALLVPESLAVAADDPFLYVVEVIALRDVARVTPQRGKSLTLFFKDHRLPCRTFLTVHTEAILADIRRMVAASSAGGKRGRDDANTAGGSALSQLLPFLTTEQTEKAKEVSSKFMNRLGKYASSMSRFLRGEDEADADGRQEPAAADPLARAFAEIEEQKAAFFRTPSKARMTEITRRYQHIAEHFAHQDSREGHVERSIEELQAFIEHPKAQRILLESCEYEQLNKGIRVGPV